jgi:hypothetical protein
MTGRLDAERMVSDFEREMFGEARPASGTLEQRVALASDKALANFDQTLRDLRKLES